MYSIALERSPVLFGGGLATCGPIGDFRGQVDYWGDFRAVFDFLMVTPDFGALPGNVSNIPNALMKKRDLV